MFICAVIVQLKKEEEEKQIRMEAVRAKMKKITTGQSKRNSREGLE